jgi:hypothetical protein
MAPERRHSPLLDNGSLSTFPKKRIGLWENQIVVTKLTHFSTAMNKHGRIEERLEVVTYIRFALEVIKRGRGRMLPS